MDAARALIFAGLLLAAPVAAALTFPAGGPLRPATPVPAEKSGGVTRHLLHIDRDALRRADAAVPVQLPGLDRPVSARFDRIVARADGRWTWVGKVGGEFGPQSALITFGDRDAFGHIPQPSGPPLRIVTRDGLVWLVEGQQDVMPDPANQGREARGTSARVVPDATPASPGRVAVKDFGLVPLVDLLVVYTPALVADVGTEAGVRTLIAYREAFTNQAFIDSRIRGQVRVVASEFIDYPINNDNNSALDDIILPSALPVKIRVDELRAQYGADLVMMIRDYDPATMGTQCGVAEINGFKGKAFAPADGFSVVADYGASGASCPGVTFQHELGHNFGSHHDYQTAGGSYGAWTFSRGHRETVGSGGFATIMAYPQSPQTYVNLFTSPTLNDCLERPCGIADYADNSRTFSLSLPQIAAYLPTKVPLAAPTLSVDDAQSIEHQGDEASCVDYPQTCQIRFSVKLSRPTPQDVIFDIGSTDGTAVAGQDYVGRRVVGMVIPAGATEARFDIEVLRDNIAEGQEQFHVVIGNLRGAQAGDAEAIGTLYRDGDRFAVASFVTGIRQNQYYPDIPSGGGDGGPADEAYLWDPRAVAAAPDGTLYIADVGSSRIRRIGPDGIISTFSNRLENNVSPSWSCLATDAAGNLYGSELVTRTVRRFTPDGAVSIVAGNGGTTSSGDGGPATAASFPEVRCLAMDRAGRIVVAEPARLRLIETDGTIRTLAGDGNAGNAGDGGPASAANVQIDYSGPMTFDGDGNLFFAQYDRVRRIGADGQVTLYAGAPPFPLPTHGYFDPVPAVDVEVAARALAADRRGNLVIYDLQRGYRRVSPQGFIEDLGITSSRYGEDYWPAPRADGMAFAPGGRLLAVDSVTDSAWAIAYPEVPAAPAAITAMPGNRRATTSFPVSADAGGSPVTGYTVRSVPQGGIDAAAGTLATSRQVTELANGTPYQFQVRARNAHGDGPWSSPSTAVTPSASGTVALSIADAELVEGASGTKLLVFPVVLSAPAPAGGVTFTLGTIEGTAKAGSDFVGRSLSGQIAAGGTGTTFAVTVAGDAVPEADEQFEVVVTALGGAVVAEGRATGTIRNDDTTIAVRDLVFTEGHAGTSVAEVVVELSHPSVVPVVFTAATADGTAKVDTDYLARNAVGRTVPAGETRASLPVRIIGDKVVETDEQFAVNLSAVTGASIADAGAVVTLVNDDAVMSVEAISMLEGSTLQNVVVQVSLSTAAPLGGVSFVLATRDGSAVAGQDYDAIPASTRVIPTGGTALSVVLPVRGDALLEGDEDLFIDITSITGSTSAPLTAKVSLLDDDFADDAIVDTIIGNGYFTDPFTSLDGTPALQARIMGVTDVAADASGAQYFVHVNTVWKVGADDVVRRFAGDGLPSYTATPGFAGDGGPATSAKLASPGAIAVDAAGNVYIADRDNRRVRRVSPDGTITTVAGNGLDGYSGDGGLAKDAAIGYVDGLVVGADAVYIDSFDQKASRTRLRRIDAAGVITTVAGNGTLSLPEPRGDAVAAELRLVSGDTLKYGVLAVAPDGALWFVATRFNSVVFYRIGADGVARPMAGRGESGPALASTTMLAATPDLGQLYEGAFDRNGVLYFLSNARLYRLSPGGVIEHIAGNPTTSGFSGDGGPARLAQFDIVQGMALDGLGRVLLADTNNGRIRRVSGLREPASAPRDVVAVAGNASATVSFAAPLRDGGSPIIGYEVASSPAGGVDPGGTTLSRAIAGLTNGIAYTFRVRARTAHGLGPFSEPSAAVTPVVAATPPTLSIADVSVVEGGVGTTTAVFTVSLSKAAPAPVTYSIATSGGSATAGVDYVARNLVGQTIAAGASSATFAVNVNGDTAVEPDETFGVAVTAVAGATVADGNATGTIRNDDSAPLPALVARPDRVVLRENAGATDIAVLANDAATASRLDTGTLAILSGPSRGSASVVTAGTSSAADDRIRYTPNPNTGGADTLTYRLCESGGSRCSDGVLRLVVRPAVDVTLSRPASAGFADLPMAGLRALPAAAFEATPAVAPSIAAPSLAADTTPLAPWDGATGTATVLRSLPATADATPRDWQVLVDGRGSAGDVDVYMGVDGNGDGRASAAEVQCAAAMGTPVERCDLALTHAGTGELRYWILVHNRGAAQSARLEIFEVPMVAGDTRRVATGPGILAATQAFPLRISWNDPGQGPGEARAGYLRVLSAGVETGRFPVRIDRDGSAVAALSLVPARPQTLRLAAGAAQDRLFVDVPAGASALTVSTSSAQNVDLYLARVAAASSPAIDSAPARALAQASAVGATGNETLTVSGSQLQPGRWYVTPVNAAAVPADLIVTASITGAAPVVRSGSFFNPARGGHGVFLYPAADQWTGLWYTYFQDGTPTWYYLQGVKPGANGIWTSGIYRAAWQGSANRLSEVGRVTLTPSGPDAFTWSYELDGQTGSEPMVSLGRGCPMLEGLALDASSSWFNPARAGTGYSTQLWPDYEYYAAFVYDARGVPRFLTAENTRFGGAAATLDLEQLTGFCPLCSRAGSPTRSTIGVMTRTLGAGTIQNITLDGIYTGGVPGAWTADEAVQTLGGPGTTQGCAP